MPHASTFGYSAGFILLVAFAIMVGMKLYHNHDQSVAAGGGPTSQPNAVNPAIAPSSFKL